MRTSAGALIGGAAVLFAIVAAGMLYVSATGLRATATPGTFEAWFARNVRRLAISPDDRARRNPIAATSAVLEDGMAHFADHCASCHGNDGSGDTELSRGLFPKAPDMRLAATQALTDGELFYIIEHGIRFTGMPGWSTGTRDGEASSWHLVHFIRRLPNLRADDIARMEALNPRPPAEIRQEIEEERFLQGSDVPALQGTSTSEQTGAHK